MYYCHPRKNFKFDVEFALKLLIEIETADFETFKTIHQKLNLDYDESAHKIGYHLVRLKEGGLLELNETSLAGGMRRITFATPTFDGHLFIKDMSNDTVKNRIFDKIKNASGEISIGTLISLASRFSNEAFS